MPIALLAWLQAAPDTAAAGRIGRRWEEVLGLSWPGALELAGRIGVILALAWLAFRVLGMLLRRLERSVGENAVGTITVQEQRVRTLVSLVQSVGIVVMRDVHGVVHIVPNGEITSVSNLTRAFSRAVMEIRVSYRENVDRAMGILRDVGREMWEDAEWRPLLTEEIAVPGIESFAESSVNIRVMATTVPLKQWDVARELRRRIKNRFDAEGIEMPLPQRTLHWGEGEPEAGTRNGQGTQLNREQEGSP